MLKLNFPTYSFRFKNKENKHFIFDPIRKKFVTFSPEEWVRQHVLLWLMHRHKISPSLISVEKQLKINSMNKRYDIVVFHRDTSIFLIVECKAPDIPITQETFDQIARYNLITQSQYLMVTNGIDHYYCSMDYEQERYFFLNELPL